MDFGLFFLMQRDEQWSEQAVYASALEQMLAAESLGYQSVWIAEHHFNDYGLCPAPQVLASFVAARTTGLRLGMGVSLLPLHHPVDLAEELALKRRDHQILAAPGRMKGRCQVLKRRREI